MANEHLKSIRLQFDLAVQAMVPLKPGQAVTRSYPVGPNLTREDGEWLVGELAYAGHRTKANYDGNQLTLTVSLDESITIEKAG